MPYHQVQDRAVMIKREIEGTTFEIDNLKDSQATSGSETL